MIIYCFTDSKCYFCRVLALGNGCTFDSMAKTTNRRGESDRGGGIFMWGFGGRQSAAATRCALCVWGQKRGDLAKDEDGD